MNVRAVLVTVVLAAVPSPSLSAWLANGPDGGRVSSVGATAGKLYAGTADGVFMSADDGENWSRLGDLPRGTAVSSVAASAGHTEPALLLAATSLAVYRSVDGGAHWTALSEPSRNLVLHPSSMYDAVTYYEHQNTRASIDGGATWSDATIVGGTMPLQASVVVADDAHGGRFYALGMDRMLYRSTNGGRSWTALTGGGAGGSRPRMAIGPATSDSLVWVDNQLDVAYMRRYQPSTNVLTNPPVSGLDRVYSMLADPVTAGRFWFTGVAAPTYREHLFESTDLGMSWNDVGEATAALLHADRVNAGVLFGTDARGFVRSADAGRTWQSRTRGIPLATVESVSIHPVRVGEILAAGAGFGISLSVDGGTTWNDSVTGLTRRNVSGIVRSAQNPDVVFAGTDDGLFRSEDGGRVWQSVAIETFPFGGEHKFGRLDIDRDDPARLAAFHGYTGLMWSDDGGIHWREAATPQGYADLRFTPHTTSGTRTVYALGFVQNIDYRLYRATAHGGDLAPVPGTTFLIGALAVHPDYDRELVALSRNGTWSTWTAYRSTDGGDTWQTRGSLPAMTLLTDRVQLRFDACDPRVLYALAGRSFYVSRNRGATWSEDPLALPLAQSRPINDLDVRCNGGVATVVTASYMGMQSRAQPVDGIFGDRFE